MLLKFRFQLRFFLLVNRFKELLILLRVFSVNNTVIVVGEMTIVDDCKVVEDSCHHLVVTLCLPQGDFKLDFHLLIGHLFADEETQPDYHMIESFLRPNDFLELRVLKKSFCPVHKPLRSAF